MEQKKWVKYENGNYTVYFNTENGTKIRRCRDNVLKPSFPENCDLLVSRQCDNGCQWCYVGCSPTGMVGNFDYAFLDHIHEYTELAVNLNFPVCPGMEEFLQKMKEKKVFVNLTVSQRHFIREQEYIEGLYKKELFYGLGISLGESMESLVYAIRHTPIKNIVIHAINGLFSEEDLKGVKGSGLKLLILGYKTCGKGKEYFEQRAGAVHFEKQWLYDNLEKVLEKFDVVSFDNLALEQLGVRELIGEDAWKLHYMGDDGTVTFAADLVSGTFSKNSMSAESWPIGDKTMEEMLCIVREEKDT